MVNKMHSRGIEGIPKPNAQREMLTLDGYNTANAIDSILRESVQRYPITPKNVRNWLNLLRQIGTTVGLLEGRCKETIKTCGLERTVRSFTEGD